MDFYTSIVICILFVELMYFKMLVSSSGVWLLTYFVVNVLSPILEDLYYMPATIAIRVGITAFAIGLNIGIFRRRSRQVKKTKLCYKAYDIYYLSVLRGWIGFVTIGIYFVSYGHAGIKNIIYGHVTLTGMLGMATSVDVLAGLLRDTLVYLTAFIFIFDRNKKHRGKNIIWLLISFSLIALFSYARSPMIYGIGIIAFYFMRNFKPVHQIIISLVAVILGMIGMITFGIVRNVGVANALTNIGYYITEVPFKDYAKGSLDFQGGYIYFIDYMKNAPQFRAGIAAYFKVFFIFIPRSVWPNKPEYLTLQILEKLHPDLLASGFSCGYGLLGEAYAIFGWMGFILVPMASGFICITLDRKYMDLVLSKNDCNPWTALYLCFSVIILVSNARGGIADSYTSYLAIIVFLLIISKFKIRTKKSSYSYKYSIFRDSEKEYRLVK